jgi:2-polyprenyl-6-methoxyphenol hydroxylase-like FAD-dependent oxidoreductase
MRPSPQPPTGSRPACSRVHVIGAGPVGLLLAALLQSVDGLTVRLYEKRKDYTRTRMVKLASYLVADSLESYRADHIDGETVQAVFEPSDIAEGLAFRRSIPTDLRSLLEEWTRGFSPLNHIEQALSQLIDTRRSNAMERVAAPVSAAEALAMVEPGDIVVDCTGTKSILRDYLAEPLDGAREGANTYSLRLEYALVVTFLYGDRYECNEHCKYYKNLENAQYKFIPAVDRTSYDGSISHVTGIVNISADDFAAMPARFDGDWLRANFPEAARSMDRFIDKVREESNGEILGDLEIIRIPLDLYRARNATSRRRRSAGRDGDVLGTSPVFLVGDSAMGSPYFQSISLGFECAMFLAALVAQQDLPIEEMQERYELLMYKQWLRVYMRSKMIKHNKDLFESVDDPLALLNKLHIY